MSLTQFVLRIGRGVAIGFALAGCLIVLGHGSHQQEEVTQEEKTEEKAEEKQVKVEDPKHQRAIDKDIERGKETAKYIEESEDFTFSSNQEYISKVERIGAELALVAQQHQVEVSWGDSRLSPFEYKFHVLEGDDINAFSIPGGFIYIYEGLIDFAESDDELAGVIAHEISHAAFRHIATLDREASKVNLATLPLIIAAVLSNDRNSGALLTGTQLAATGIFSGWSVKAEKSADYGGIQYMMNSDYNPLGVLTFMERLGYQQRLRPRVNWGIYETHPPHQERAQSIIRELNEADIPINRSEVTTSLRSTWVKTDSGIQLFFGETALHEFSGLDAETRANKAVRRLNSFYDSVPALFELEQRGDSMYGRNRKLFSISEDDAAALELTQEEALAKTYSAMRKTVFDLAYRMWNSNGR